MPKRTPDQLRYWSETNKVIGQKLRAYYQACTTEKLPPELLAVLKKLRKFRKLMVWRNQIPNKKTVKVKNPNAPAVKREVEEDWR